MHMKNLLFKKLIENITAIPHPSEGIRDSDYSVASPDGRAAWRVGLRQLACCECRFESRREHSCLSLASVVCCQVEVSATGRSLVQRIPTKFV